jgi:hypothetical protein
MNRPTLLLCIVFALGGTGLGGMSSAWAAPAPSTTAVEAFSKCLTDNSSGKDRIVLMRWIFTVIAAHPDLADLSNVTAEQRTAASKEAGMLFTRLIGETCSVESKAASAADPNALRNAFGALGQTAMQELMGNNTVSADFSEIAKYIDAAKIRAATGQK